MGISGTELFEVPTIYKAYVLGLNFRESPSLPTKYGQQYGTVSTSICWILKISQSDTA